MNRYKETVSFSGSATSSAFNMSGKGCILAIRIPANFGAASITLTHSDTLTGTYDAVTDYSDAAITITTNPTTAKMIDLSDIFPLGVGATSKVLGGWIKFVASTSITKDIIVYTGGE